jgi:hypothetical protein
VIALQQWAERHNVPPQALKDLLVIFGIEPTLPTPLAGMSEAAVDTRVCLQAPKLGWRLWRNNVGAGKLENGSFVRWGLANESTAMNRKIKSADRIGIAPVLIKPEHVGQTIGQFCSIEVKHGAWKYTGTEHEEAQLRWAKLVTSLGGLAMFSTGELTNSTVSDIITP